MGVHVRALAECLQTFIEELPELPTTRRVTLRNTLAALKRAYPAELGLNEVELAHELAEEDGDAVPETV